MNDISKLQASRTSTRWKNCGRSVGENIWKDLDCTFSKQRSTRRSGKDLIWRSFLWEWVFWSGDYRFIPKIFPTTITHQNQSHKQFAEGHIWKSATFKQTLRVPLICCPARRWRQVSRCTKRAKFQECKASSNKHTIKHKAAWNHRSNLLRRWQYRKLYGVSKDPYRNYGAVSYSCTSESRLLTFIPEIFKSSMAAAGAANGTRWTYRRGNTVDG